jgi:amidohydrolase family protein
MKKLLSLLLFASAITTFSQTLAPDTRTTVAYTNGNWFDGHRFQPKTGYSVDGILSFRKPAHVDAVIDLGGGFVLPPFGEAHNHNVEPLNKIDQLVQRYLQRGIFYVKNPNNLPKNRDEVLPKVNRPESIDVIFSNGGFTGKDGHPAELVKRNIDRGIWTKAAGEGAFYYTVSNEAELGQKWPQFLATKPDFVKTYLLFSEEYAARKDDPKYFGWKGLNPSLLKAIVQKAHTAGLRVSTHVESAADFHNALMTGVDEINHTPGFRTNADVKPHALSEFQIAEADAAYAARHGVYVVTTLADSSASPLATQRDSFTQRDELNRRNLGILQKYHVKMALGSDAYRSDTLPEALYLASLRVFDNRTLLSIWCNSTAKAIFPRRKIGELKEGYEANFIVLKANPIRDFSAVQHLSMAVKQGHVLPLDPAISAGSN